MSTSPDTPRTTAAAGTPTSDWESVAVRLFDEAQKLERELATKDAAIATLRAALMDASCFWQAATMHYGENHLLRDAEDRALAVRDAALEATR